MSNSERLSDYAAGEIRAWLGRRRISGRELARRLGVSSPWVSNRLTGHLDISLNELQRIAEALDVELADLLPQPALRDGRSGQRTNNDSSQPANRPTSERLMSAQIHPAGIPHQVSERARTREHRTGVRRPRIRSHRHAGVTQ